MAKKKRGRPKIATNKKLAERLELRLSDSEKKAIESLASAEGMAVSEWARKRLLGDSTSA